VIRFFLQFPLTFGVSCLLFIAYPWILLSSWETKSLFYSFPGDFSPLSWILCTWFHGSWEHLLSNLFFLFLLGRVVEGRVGVLRWCLFYSIAGLLSVLGDSFVRGFLLGDRTPIVGASGAISGLAEVATFLSPFRFPLSPGRWIPFPVFLLGWVMIYSNLTNLFSKDRIAHWAHLAGFFSVLLTAYLLGEKERKQLQTSFLLNLGFFTLTLVLAFFINNR